MSLSKKVLTKWIPVTPGELLFQSCYCADATTHSSAPLIVRDSRWLMSKEIVKVLETQILQTRFGISDSKLFFRYSPNAYEMSLVLYFEADPHSPQRGFIDFLRNEVFGLDLELSAAFVRTTCDVARSIYNNDAALALALREHAEI